MKWKSDEAYKVIFQAFWDTNHETKIFCMKNKEKIKEILQEILDKFQVAYFWENPQKSAKIWNESFEIQSLL